VTEEKAHRPEVRDVRSRRVRRPGVHASRECAGVDIERAGRAG
jgi:hypothetical protein